jgi:hypothetical protein
VHVRASTALVPAVLRLENPGGHTFLPGFVMHVSKPFAALGAQTSSASQPAPDRGAWQSRPAVRAPLTAGVGVQEVGPTTGAILP